MTPFAEFRRALEIDPRNSDAHNNLGLALLLQHKPDDAIAEFRRTLEIDPANEFAKSRLDDIVASANSPAKIDKPKKSKRRARESLGRSGEER
jgi:Tfp pilus assembly protein PilF